MVADRRRAGRDASAWPAGAGPLSVLIGGGALVVGVLVVVSQHRPAAAAASLVLAMLAGASLLLFGMWRWWQGHPMPVWPGLVGVVLLIAGSPVVGWVTGGAGLPIVGSGMVGAMMLANAGMIWYVRTHQAPGGPRSGPGGGGAPHEEHRPAPQPHPYLGVVGEDYLSFALEAPAGLILFGDRDARKSPLWADEADADGVVSDESSVLAGVRPPAVGEVRVEVVVDQPPPGGHEIFSGVLELPSGVIEAGSPLTGRVERLDISPARAAQVRVFVEPRDAPARVTALVTPG